MSASTAAIVNVRVLLFASYAETLGFDSIELSLEHPATVGSALERLRALPGGDRLPPKPLCALNLTHARFDTPLSGGDELAILPPLSGG
jgi:molybdopterin converting factor small subunit